MAYDHFYWGKARLRRKLPVKGARLTTLSADDVMGMGQADLMKLKKPELVEAARLVGIAAVDETKAQLVDAIEALQQLASDARDEEDGDALVF